MALRNTSLVPLEHKKSVLIFGASIPVADLVVRQILTKDLHAETKVLLKSLGDSEKATVIAFPTNYLRAIESFGFKVDYYRSSTLFSFKAVFYLLAGIAQIIINLITHSKIYDSRKKNDKNFTYFCDLNKNNLPQPPGSSVSYCIINWYRKWEGKNKDLETIVHGVRDYDNEEVGETTLLYSKSPFPSLIGVCSVLNYVVWSIKAIFLSTAALTRGHWWYPLLLREASFAALVRCGDIKTLARQYWFHNSRPYPPLWTYELPSLGSQAIFYWYSTNSEPIEFTKRPASYDTPYALMNWPRHLVWDVSQKNFVKRCSIEEAEIDVVGPIWFEDGGKILSQIQGLVVAVFDVQPYRMSLYSSFGLAAEYYVPSIVNDFVEGILEAAQGVNVTIVWKKKRNIPLLSHRAYLNFSQRLLNERRLIAIDPDISAFSLINHADAVISLPFTSTAQIANCIGKPSVYYDPSGKVHEADQLARGTKVLNNRVDLTNWLLKNVDNIT